MQKGFVPIYFLLGGVVLVAVILGAIFFVKTNNLTTFLTGHTPDRTKVSQIPTSAPMEDKTVQPCDLNEDGKCDSADQDLFKKYLGSKKGDSNYYPLADADANGVVDETDRHMLFPTTQTGSPEQVTEAYYKWYTDCLNNHFNNPKGNSPSQDCDYLNTTYISYGFNENFNGSPICATNIGPTKLVTKKISESGNYAKVEETLSIFPNNHIEVDLKREDNDWKITNIVCKN